MIHVKSFTEFTSSITEQKKEIGVASKIKSSKNGLGIVVSVSGDTAYCYFDKIPGKMTPAELGELTLVESTDPENTDELTEKAFAIKKNKDFYDKLSKIISDFVKNHDVVDAVTVVSAIAADLESGDFVTEDNVELEDGEKLEEKVMAIKRKYTERFPAVKVLENAPKRNKIISFINSKGGSITEEEWKEYCSRLTEEEGETVGRTWMTNNKDLVKKTRDELSQVRYNLTVKAQRIIKNLTPAQPAE